ncbi:MAG: beta-lactamase family protein [Ferruginibacter sp.]|nr:beta-lactamase family protein [Bacteroidota bacterium]MBX2918856.1 beta-lactamase family protein [Ferruginibacter sp.]
MKNINSFLKDQVENHQTPSVNYAFFDTNSIIYEMKYGLKNIKYNEPVNETTMYHLFSVTKTFTALAVLQLAQLGKIELSKPVSLYLPEFPYSREITVKQLLSHTSGIPNPLPLKWIHLDIEHDTFSRDQFFAKIFSTNPKLCFDPNTGLKYSNLGYVLLGQLIERVSGTTFENYVTENIIKPSGIASTELSFQIEPTSHAIGYHKWWSLTNAIFGLLINKEKFMGKKEGKWKPFKYFYNNGIAYGGMFGSASGLIKYAQALLPNNSILINDYYKNLLFTETTVNDRKTGMSLSWFTGTLKGNKYFCHAGGGGGYYVELRVYPQLGVGSIIMFNRSGMKDERLLDKTDAFFITGNNRMGT